MGKSSTKMWGLSTKALALDLGNLKRKDPMISMMIDYTQK